MKLGILYPRSNAHPGLMADFMDGIKAAINHTEMHQHIRISSESIAFGGNEKEVYEKAEKILVLEAVDILVAYIDLRVLELIKPLLYASGKLVLVVNPGANYPQNWVPQPNIICLTLQHGFLCWLTGKLAIEKKKLNAVMATSFYDCGYLHTAAMVKGFAGSGQQVRFNYVNNQRYDDSFHIQELTDYLSSTNDTNSLLCVFDSLPASMFYSRLNTFPNAGNLDLFVSPMMLEPKAVEHTSEGFNFSIYGYQPWHSLIENNANSFFTKNYRQQTNREVTVFSLLGWETALIIHQIFKNGSDNYADGTAVAESLKEIVIDSPRGEMRLDEETNYFVTPVIKCSLPANTSEMLTQTVNDPQAEWEAFVSDPVEGATSGWNNTYLCY
jgi:branched-chain amino acid transport system substrate-binding protein